MQPIKITVLISGGGTNLEALLEAIDRQTVSARVVQVISSRPEAYGLVRARQHGIQNRVLPEIDAAEAAANGREELLLQWLGEAQTDLVVLAGYLKQVPERVVEAYAERIINIHPSLIPAFSGPGWYGNRVHEGVWQRGVKVTGATVHFVNGEMDGGPIILQEPVILAEGDDPAAIGEKVLAVEHRLLAKAVALYVAGRIRVEGHRAIILEKEGMEQ